MVDAPSYLAAAKSSRGLADIVAASTAVSDVDVRVGRLIYRGYDAAELSGRISFEECVYLLQRGALPNRRQLDAVAADLALGRQLGPTVEAVLDPVSATATPMEALRTLVSVAGSDDPDKSSNKPDANQRKAVRLVAQVPVLLARYHAARTGTLAPEPDPGLGTPANFLYQLTGKPPEPELRAAFEAAMVLHADHTMNASTFAARVCAATLTDMHSAVVAAVGTLKGPLHGGASEAVMRLLESIESVDEVEPTVLERLARGEKVMGFGHRIYRRQDPRAELLRALSRQLSEITGSDRYYELSVRMQEVVFDHRGLYPNIDFYTASLYAALGIPADMFSAVTAMARTAGWTAHVMEQHLDNRLIRPDSEYVGERDRRWIPIEER
jgi:citrate synthase